MSLTTYHFPSGKMYINTTNLLEIIFDHNLNPVEIKPKGGMWFENDKVKQEFNLQFVSPDVIAAKNALKEQFKNSSQVTVGIDATKVDRWGDQIMLSIFPKAYREMLEKKIKVDIYVPPGFALAWQDNSDINKAIESTSIKLEGKYDIPLDVNNLELRFKEGKEGCIKSLLDKMGLSLINRTPVYKVSDKERAWAENHLKGKKQHLIGIALESADKSRTYSKMEKVVQQLQKEGYKTVILDKKSGKKYNYTFREMAAVIEQCDLILTSDSAPLHLAGALKKRVVGVFGHTDGKIMIQDYEKASAVQASCTRGIQGPCWWTVDCLPGDSYQKKAVAGYADCLEHLKVKEVVDAVNAQFLKPKKVLVVMLTYNLLSMTKQAIQSVRSFHEYDLFVIDNKSDDGTVAYLKANKIDYISKQLSVPQAWNLGMKTAYNKGYDYILICNNDIILSDNYIDVVVEVAERRHSYVTTGEVLNTGDIRKPVTSKLSEQVLDKIEPGEYSAFLVSRECIEKIGGFNEKFGPRYQTDEDHVLRLRFADHPPVRTSATSFFHALASVIDNIPKEKEKNQTEWNNNVKLFQRIYNVHLYNERKAILTDINEMRKRNLDWKEKIYIPLEDVKEMENKKKRITVITPTGDRPLAFVLCRHWMEEQTVQPDQWIVVDDGKVPIVPDASMEYVRREPSSKDSKHTQLLNLKLVMALIKGDKILIMEDDDYYAPKYIETMSAKLDKHEVVGINKAKYYHLFSNGWHRYNNIEYASLAQTAFQASFLTEFGEEIVSNQVTDSRGFYLDMRLWERVWGSKRGFLFTDDNKPLQLSIKGLPGRQGLAPGHDSKYYIYEENARDTSHKVLKQWIPKDYNIYLDVINRKLTGRNYKAYFPKITGITVCSNTKDFMKKTYKSVRKFHPDMPIIIIDGSDANDPCASYVKSLASKLTTVVSLGYNIGHGRGLCKGIGLVKTKYALIFDSDIEMLKSPVSQMLAMMEEDTYGVGYNEKTGFDGFVYGVHPHHAQEGSMFYLHPYFQLINIINYKKFHPYVHHGAPCYLAMLDIHKQGLSNKILKEFPGLGHSKGATREYIKHELNGTRGLRQRRGLPPIAGGWEYKKTICFLTPCHPSRPNMQKTCFNSVKAQTCNDYQHFVLQGSMRENEDGTLAWEAGIKKSWPQINAQYIMRLDDDNMLVYPDFVKEFKQLTQKENPDVVIFKGNIKGMGIIPKRNWLKPPVHGDIDWFNYAIKQEMWNKYIQELRHECGLNNDYLLIRNCYQNTQSVSWMDRVVAKTQRGPMRGAAE